MLPVSFKDRNTGTLEQEHCSGRKEDQVESGSGHVENFHRTSSGLTLVKRQTRATGVQQFMPDGFAASYRRDPYWHLCPILWSVCKTSSKIIP